MTSDEPHTAGAPAPARFRHIGCCVSDSPAAEVAIANALGMRAEGVRLSLVHVAPRPLLVESIDGAPVARPEDISAADRRWLDELARRVPGAEPVVLEGLPGPAICRWAEDEGADLLVTTARHGPWGMAVLGSVSRHLVDHAPCPVLVARLAAGDRGGPGGAQDPNA